MSDRYKAYLRLAYVQNWGLEALLYKPCWYDHFVHCIGFLYFRGKLHETSQQIYILCTIQGTLEECLLNSLDILTFVVPPILPAALTANNAFAQKRLEKQGIFCLHSKHISLCGGIDVVAFDKVKNSSNKACEINPLCKSRALARSVRQFFSFFNMI